MEDWADAIKKRIEDRAKAIQEKATIAVDDATKEMISKLNEWLLRVGYDAALDFYSDYHPTYYKRKYTLYNIPNVEITNGGESLRLNFDSSAASKFRKPGATDNIYELVYKKGHHGGGGYITTPAVTIPSPYDQIKKEIDDFRDGEMLVMYKELIVERLNKMGITTK